MLKDHKTNPEIYDICQLLHVTTGLNVAYFDAAHAGSLVFRQEVLPTLFEESLQRQAQASAPALKERPRDAFLFCTDSLLLRYLAIGHWESEAFAGTVMAGPFLFDIPNEAFVADIVARNRLPESLSSKFLNDYRLLRILDFERYAAIGRLMVNLVSRPLLLGEMVQLESRTARPVRKGAEIEDADVLHSQIELRYRRQNELLAAVETGDTEAALKSYQLTRFNPTERVPNNPLRAHKNISLAFNTMLRMAAERAQVSPVFLNEISSRFATLVERVSNISELETLLKTMIVDYCSLVKKMAIRGASPGIRKAVSHIQISYAKPLTLVDIAAKANLNPSHLSRQFKKEMGMTVTEFINRKRIERARELISQGSRAISDVATAVGFESQSYFATVFRQVTGLSPSAYIKNPGAESKGPRA